MSSYIEVPAERLGAEVLQGLLEEFASRDGTDYGEREVTLSQKVGNLQGQLRRGDLLILYETESESWDLLPREQARTLLDN